MEAMQTSKDEPIVEEMDYDKEPVYFWEFLIVSSDFSG